jgi:flavin reductase (DIM6/NTAB) family NADH-FMN oxidoreductase RutF
MDLPAAEIPWQTAYKLLTGAIVPRPIGWISTVDAAGKPNLAPFSFFNVAAANPPHVLFCPMVRSDGSHKDTLGNIQATGEFVVNIVTAALAEAMNATSLDAPAEVNEFEIAHLLTQPSLQVAPPRVAASPIHFECRLTQIVTLSDAPGGGSVVIGRIVQIHVAPEVLLGGDKIDPAALQPIARMGGSFYCRATDLFAMERPTLARPKG